MTERRNAVSATLLAAIMICSLVAVGVATVPSSVAAQNDPTGELTFVDQPLAADGTVTVEDVSTGQESTVVVTYTDGDEEVIAGLADADNLGSEDVQVEIEDAGGFPGEHTAWVFDDETLEGVEIGPGDGVIANTPFEDAGDVQEAALDFESADVFEAAGELTFTDQDLIDGEVTVEDVSTGQESTVVVTYTDGDEEVIAGIAAADNLESEDLQVEIEDAGGFPGEHTAWVFADVDVPAGVGIGDDATPIAGDALDSETAVVSEAPTGELTFNDQELDDGELTVEEVSTSQESTIVVTYFDEDAGDEIVAGIAAADDLESEDLQVAIEDDGGFPGEHTAWMFDDETLAAVEAELEPGDGVIDSVDAFDEPADVQDAALDFESAEISETQMGELTFAEQPLAADGTVTVEDVSTGQESTVVVTYTDGDDEVIAGLADADNLDSEDVQVEIEDDGGFPGEHTAWVFDDDDVPEDVDIGDDAAPIAGDALDSETANVFEAAGELTFTDQELAQDGTVTVEEVSTEQESTVVVTYTDEDEEVIAGLAEADELDSEDVQVLIEDDGGFPGEHTAWVFADVDVPEGIGIGDDATDVAPAALDSDTAAVSEAPSGELTFNDQELAEDDTVTVENVSTAQESTVVVTYAGENEDGDGDEIVAGIAAADDLSEEDVQVLIEDAGGFPGEHTAWVFDDETLEGVEIGPGDGVIANTPFEDAGDVQEAALDFDSADVTAPPEGELTFADQELIDGEVTVENVSTAQESTVVVTYTDDAGDVIAAGIAAADDLSEEDVQVLIEDAGGFPGEHTAWVFDDAFLADAGLADLEPGDEVPADAATENALDFESADISEAPTGELTFADQDLIDGEVTAENVSTGQESTIVVTYFDEDAGDEIVAGIAAADNLEGEDVQVAIEDAGGFPGEHTAWLFDDEALAAVEAELEPGDGVIESVGAFDEPADVQGAALDFDSADVTALNELTFLHQELVDGEVIVEDVTSSQESTVVVTYTDSDEEVVAGVADADNLDSEDVQVAIEDAGGFPGEHTAWLFDDDDLPDDLGIGDDATPVADLALDFDSAMVIEPTADELTFNDQELDDGDVLVENVTSSQASTVVVTYTDGEEEIVAGLADADNLDDENVSVTIENTGGFPGEHTAWLFDDGDLPDDLGVGDDATPVAGAALDVESATVSAPPEGELTFTDQELIDGEVTVENVTTAQESTIVVTYTDGEAEIIAGLGEADDLDAEDVQVEIEDDGGFPGEHTAWVFDDDDLPAVGIGDDATPVAGDALDSETANITEAEEDDDPSPRPSPGPSPAPAPGEAEFVLEAVTEQVTVQQGENATVNATVRNDGDETGTATVEFELNPAAVAEIELEPGEEETVTFVVDTTELDGDVPFSVRLDDAEKTGTITVEVASGALTFADQGIENGEVLVENVTTEQTSTVVVTYTDGDEEIVAGVADADTLDGEDVSVLVMEDGGFPGEHTAWVFADEALPPELEIGDDATPVADAALDSESAVVSAVGELTFNDQELDGGEVTVEEVSTEQTSTVVVTYTDGDEEIVAGVADADALDGEDVSVLVMDDGGFPGEHTAWVFFDGDLPDDLGIGDDATPVADAALDADSADVTESDPDDVDDTADDADDTEADDTDDAIADDMADDADDTADDDGAGFGLVVGLFGLVALAVLGRHVARTTS